MARLSAITRLLQGLQSPPHQYSLPTGIFPSLNAEKLASDMLLAEKGTRRGQENLPATGSKGFDQIEQQIINRIEEERRATAASYADQLQTYSTDRPL